MQASSTAKTLAATSSATVAAPPSSSGPPSPASTSASALPSAKGSAADSSCEIEEISKKISEHADAIYRTWKCRGLAPTELLDFYTSAASAVAADATGSTAAGADFFGPSKVAAAVVADEKASTEGLQKLVSTFVIKDKEQRSAKAKNGTGTNNNSAKVSNNKSNVIKSPILAGDATTDLLGESAVMVGTKSKATSIMKQAKPVTQRPSAILLPDTTTTPATTATAATAITKTAKTKTNDVVTGKKLPTTMTTPTTASATTTTTAAATAASGKSPREATTSGPTRQSKSAGASKAGGAQQAACEKLYQNSVAATEAKTKTTASSGVGGGGGGKSRKGITKGAKGQELDPPLDLNLDIGLDLDLDLKLKLDVNNLTQLQTENLLKIKELLQQESASDKPKKTKIATATKRAASTASTTGAATPTATTAATSTVTATGIATTPTTARRHALLAASKDGDNAKTVGCNDVVVVADKNTIAANAKPNEQQTANPNQSQNKAKGEEKSTKARVIKASSSSNNNTGSSNSAGGGANSNANSSPKTTKEKSAKGASKASSSIPTAATAAAVAVAGAATTISPATTTATATSATSASAATSAPTTTAAGTENVMEVARSTMPAPTKVKPSRPLTNGQDKNLGRPILTRGSVAERVMLFEKCPDVRNSFLNIKRPDPADAPPKSLLKAKLHATPPPPPDQNSLQRQIRTSGKNVYIPRFYFPHGKPQPQIAVERTIRNILSAFDSFPNNQVTKDELPRILKLCGLPFYWRMPVLVFCQQGQSGLVERTRYLEFWKQMNVYCHDNASRFVYIMSRGQRFRSYILPEDLAPLVQDVVDTHPGLAFLKEATEFHSRYVHTVIARIFYSVNRSWSGKISIAELKKSDLLEIIALLEEEDDINQIMAFFSYEHFYVIYCKFWELDRDHDLLINQDDLARHSDHALSTRIVERIFSGCVTRSDNRKNPDDEPKMSYTDFVWFLLSEEDKRTPTAIEYWFRCMDVDGDGLLSMYELEYFYEEQQQRMESIGIETLPFEDCLCQMLDMIKPNNRDCITLGDLKRCKMTHVFFDTFFNLEKYLDHEQRDPFASQRDEYSSDWDRFAAQEYELLITEEND